ATHLAVFMATTVEEQFLLEIARLAVATNKVAQCGAAALDGMSQNALDLDSQLQITRPGNALGFASRIDACRKQRFGRVDIAHSHHHRVVHDERLYRHGAPAR